MKNKFYTCKYCHEEYVPRRRNHQKYCSNSCRSKAYHIRQRDKGNNTTTNEVENAAVNKSVDTTAEDNEPKNNSTSEVFTTSKEKNPKTKVDAISFAGVGNAALGVLAVNVGKHLLTKEEDRPVTKKDLLTVLQRMARYYRVNNLPKRIDQTIPVFDTHNGNIEYVTKERALFLLNPLTNF